VKDEQEMVERTRSRHVELQPVCAVAVATSLAGWPARVGDKRWVPGFFSGGKADGASS
jgi:hypothetical protein